MIYGKWSVQASKQANIYMHGCNEVMLVWGSPRLTPIMYTCRVNAIEDLIGAHTYACLCLYPCYNAEKIDYFTAKREGQFNPAVVTSVASQWPSGSRNRQVRPIL